MRLKYESSPDGAQVCECADDALPHTHRECEVGKKAKSIVVGGCLEMLTTRFSKVFTRNVSHTKKIKVFLQKSIAPQIRRLIFYVSYGKG
jgi:hypothetical protein